VADHSRTWRDDSEEHPGEAKPIATQLARFEKANRWNGRSSAVQQSNQIL
jgi:hypothetical protein